MAIEIEKLTIDEYNEIIRIWLIAGLPHKPKGRDSKELIAKEMQNPNCCYFGLYKDNYLIGTSIGNFDGRRGWINRVAIDPDYRKRGYAGLLIEETVKFLEDRGALVICALIEDINYPSITTFNKAGFTCENKFLYFTKRQSDDA